MDDQVHEVLDFQVEGFKRKEECHCHHHHTIEEAIEHLTKSVRESSARLDEEEGYDQLDDSNPEKNHVSKASEEQISRIHKAFPDSKNDQAHHLDLLHKVLHSQLQVDMDKHEGEVHHHKKKHVEHYENLKKAYLDSFQK